MLKAVGLTDDDFTPWPATSIVSRVLANIRAASTRHDRLRTRLWAVELSMLVPHHSLYSWGRMQDVWLDK